MRVKKKLMMNEQCFTPLSTVFQANHCNTSHHLCLSWVLSVLDWGSEVSCPRHSHEKLRGSTATRTQDPWIISQTHYKPYKPFENTVGNGEITRNEQFLLFPKCFLTTWRTFCHFYQI